MVISPSKLFFFGHLNTLKYNFSNGNAGFRQTGQVYYLGENGIVLISELQIADSKINGGTLLERSDRILLCRGI